MIIGSLPRENPRGLRVRVQRVRVRVSNYLAAGYPRSSLGKIKREGAIQGRAEDLEHDESFKVKSPRAMSCFI
jgi:hypothetical protein